jgi:hypothetical protein
LHRDLQVATDVAGHLGEVRVCADNRERDDWPLCRPLRRSSSRGRECGSKQPPHRTS